MAFATSALPCDIAQTKKFGANGLCSEQQAYLPQQGWAGKRPLKTFEFWRLKAKGRFPKTQFFKNFLPTQLPIQLALLPDFVY